MRGAIFDDQIARLGNRFRCLAPDMPGHAGAAHLPPTLDACADVIEAALAVLDDPAPLVVGWSMGAAALWRYIGRAGTARLGGIVTVDMSPKIVPGPGWPHGLKGQSAESVAASTRRIDTDWPAMTHGIAATMFAKPEGVPGMDHDIARALILSHDPAAMRALWHGMVAMDARPIVPRIDIPWLVASGALSRVYPASTADWLAALAPNATRHVFAHSGHSPHLEEPQSFARVIADFADSL